MKWTLEIFVKRLLVILGIAVVFSFLLFIGNMDNLRALLWCTTILLLVSYGWYMETTVSCRKKFLSKLIGVALFLLSIAIAVLFCLGCGMVVERLFDWYAIYWEITALKGFGLCFCLKVLYELGKASAWWFDVPQMVYVCFMWAIIFGLGLFLGFTLISYVWPLLPF